MPNLVSVDGPIRSRYLPDRILLALLYKPADPDIGFNRLPDGSLLLKMAPVGKEFKLNSTRFFDQLLFLQAAGYLEKLDMRAKWGHVLVRPTLPAGLLRPSLPVEDTHV